MRPKAYIQLGRIGDILNILPLMWRLNQVQRKPVLCVAAENRGVVEDLPYVEAHYYPGHHDLSERAAAWMKLRKPGYDMVISQVWNNPDRRMTAPSYAVESWRLAGNHEHEYGMWPLYLPQVPEWNDKRPCILFAGHSISSPLEQGRALYDALKAEFGASLPVVNLADVRVAKVPELLALYRNAVCLVTVDTMHLHLARASDVPVVALINDGWLGSVPPPNAVSTIRYADLKVERVLDEVRKLVRPPHAKIYHAVDLFGQSERHLRAQASWERIGAERVSFTTYPRTAADIGDARALPYMKDLLMLALDRAQPHDIIAWTSDDVSVSDQTEAWLRLNVARYGAISARRQGGHIGRDLFAFRGDWLRQHWGELPDFILGAPDFDLGLAALIRMKRGVKSRLANMIVDFPGCEPQGAGIWHEDHKSEWMHDGHEKTPSVMHNRKCIMQWAAKHAQNMVFNNEGVMT